MLRNPIYIGKVPYKGELFDGLHEAIIPMELSFLVDVGDVVKLTAGELTFIPCKGS